MALVYSEFHDFSPNKQSKSSTALAAAALGGDDDSEKNELDEKAEPEKLPKRDNDLLANDDDAFYKKYSVPVLLGPFLPAVFALIVIVSGEITLNTWSGTCGFDLPAFVSAAIAVCYLFLLVYTWVFVGDTIQIQSKSLGFSFTLFRPFRSLRTIAFFYLIIAIFSFIVWIVGTVLLQLSSFCQATSPTLYDYVLFLVVTYWLGFFITLFYVVKLFFGSNIAKMMKEATRASTIDEVEERIFKSKFQEYDKDKENKIKDTDLPALLESLGVYVPEEEVSTLQSTLDPEESGFILYHDLLTWFKKLNSELEQRDVDIGDDDDDEYGKAGDDGEGEDDGFRKATKKKT